MDRAPHTMTEDTPNTPKMPSDDGVHMPQTPLTDDVDKILAEAEEKLAGTPERVKEIRDAKENAISDGTPPEAPKERPRGAIRTFHDDVAETVKTKQVSLADIAVAETKRKEKKGAPSAEKQPKSASVRVFVVVGTILVALLAIGGGIVWYRSLVESAVPPVPVRTIPIPVNEEKVVEVPRLLRSVILDIIDQEVGRAQTPLGSVRDIRLQGEGTGIDITSGAFLTALDVRAPESLVRALDDTFVLGVHGFTRDEVFLLFSVRDFRLAFAAMLNWETFLTADLPFAAHGNRAISGDVVIRNKDARVLLDANGTPVLYYAFPDEQTLVIAGTETTLIEIFDRLTRPQFR